MGNMMEQTGKNTPSFLFLQSGRRASGKVMVPLGSRGNSFFLCDLPLGDRTTPWQGTQGDGDPTGLLVPLPVFPGSGSQADLSRTYWSQVAE